MKVFAIIVTYNGEVWIRKCLKSLMGSILPITVIVVDNNSKDQTKTIVKTEFKEVYLIENGSNLGFGQANNIGLKMALKENCDFAFLLNQDAWVAKDTIQQLISLSKVYNEYGLLAPFQLDYEGNTIEKYFNDYVIGQYTPSFISDLYKGQLKPIYPSAFIHAAAWLMPKKTLQEVGGFDPLFFHYGEDNDYVQRLQHKKYLIGFVPHAIMYHNGSNDGLINVAENERLKFNFVLLKLKQPVAGMAGGTLVFLKSSFDSITSALIYRRFKTLKIEFNIFFKVFRQLLKVSRSKKLQAMERAYLN